MHASSPVILFPLRNQLQQVQYPLLALIGMNILQHRGRLAILRDDDRAVPVGRARDQFGGAAFESRDGFDIVLKIHGPDCSTKSGSFYGFGETRSGALNDQPHVDATKSISASIADSSATDYVPVTFGSCSHVYLVCCSRLRYSPLHGPPNELSSA